jgi:ABC-type transport system involved in multi-copper enzyme maturation permease subunit
MSLLYWAELLKLWGRPAARLGLVALVALGAAGPLLLFLASGTSLSVNGENVAERLDLCAANGAAWSWWLRGFYVAQTVLLVLASQSFAGELTAHTLRDELVRPVHRWAVYTAKVAALATFSFASTLGSLCVAIAAGFVLLPASGDASWAAVFAGAGATWLCESAFAVFALTVSVVTRSVAGGLATALLFVLVERLVGFGFTLVSWVLMSIPPELASVPPGIERLLGAAPFLPSAGWTAWEAVSRGEPLAWQHWAALLGWTVLSGAVGLRQFSRTEVP